MKRECAFTICIALEVMGCSQGYDETFGKQSESLLGGATTLAVYQDWTLQWAIDASGDGAWGAGDTLLTGNFGDAGDVALVGYGPSGTCGTGGGRIGVWRPSTRQFFLDQNGDKVWQVTDRTISNLMPALAGFTDQPFIYSINTSGGEFPDCKGVVGYFRTPNAGGVGNWYIDLNDNGTIGAGEGPFAFGGKGDVAVPLVGSIGGSRLTVFRTATGEWFKDQNGNRAWDNCSLDTCTVFGAPNDAPFGHPNSGYRGVSRGALRAIDANQNGVWDGADLALTFGNAGAQGLLID